MELKACIAALGLNLILLGLAPMYGQAQETDQDLQRTLIKRMDSIQEELIKVTDNLGQLDTDLEKALEECLGIHNELCEAMEIEARMKDQRDLQSYWSPGKRSGNDRLGKSLAVLQELRRKRQVLGKLKNALKTADNVMTSERKRSCRFNLGFHCDTEEIFDFADMYDYVSSSNSPGKKRSVNRRKRRVFS